MCHTPIVIRLGQLEPFVNNLTMKYPQNRGKHVRLMPIGASARPMATFSGFYESPGPPPLDNVRVIVTGQQSEFILLLFCLLSPWRPLQQYGASSWES
jgi:hypothetical protein